jgi:hypothetical protein
MSALTDRLSEANFRELARLIRETHARHAARLERERAEAEASTGRDPGDGGGEAAAAGQ